VREVRGPYSFGTSLSSTTTLLGPLSPLLLLFWDLSLLYYYSFGTSLTSTALVVEVRGSSGER